MNALSRQRTSATSRSSYDHRLSNFTPVKILFAMLVWFGSIDISYACSPESDVCPAEQLVDTKWMHNSGSWGKVVNASDYIYPSAEAAMEANCEKFRAVAPKKVETCPDGGSVVSSQGIILSCPTNVKQVSSLPSFSFSFRYKHVVQYCDGTGSVTEHDGPSLSALAKTTTTYRCTEGFPYGPDANKSCWRCSQMGSQEDSSPKFLDKSTVRLTKALKCYADIPVIESCKVKDGNPIACRTGEKFQTEVDYQSPSGLQFARRYQSNPNPSTDVFQSKIRHVTQAGLPDNWTLDGDVSFKFLLDEPKRRLAEIRLGDGGRLLFTGATNTVTTLQSNTWAHGSVRQIMGNWRWTSGNGTQYVFGAGGKLASKTQFGKTWTYQWQLHNNGEYLLTSVTEPLGRKLTLEYDATGRLITMRDPSGNAYRYEYDFIGNIQSVLFPDDTPYDPTDNPRKQYVYEDARFPKHLTGIIDENGQRYATWAYDALGRGILSEHAGGANKTTFEYLETGNTIVQYHQNAQQYRERLKVIDRANGSERLLREEDFPCPGCVTGTESFEYGTDGWLSKKTDRLGLVTTYKRDFLGNETQRIEALGKPEQRTINTTWDTNLRVPKEITLGTQKTTNSYFGVGSGKDGLLLQTLVLDTSTNISRLTKYTYTTKNLLSSVDGPRTDASDITNYTYDAFGNLTSVTNALGHVTTLSNYDAAGRVGKITDANGLVTTLTYTVRGWLKTRTVGTLTTTFDYDKVGQLTQVTMPDGSFVNYEYDAAHRLTAIQNMQGERIEYTLDYAGNRTKEEIKNAQGQVVLRRSSEFNALNQLVKSLNAANQVTASFAYDANGNMTGVSRFTESETSTSGYSFDPLNRLNKITDALNGITEFGYDNLDQLQSVKDPKGLTTQYSVSALGELKTTNSPDTANSTQTFDSAGNVKTSTNARGHTSTYSYDALNRVTQIKYHDNSAVVFAYDSTVNGNFGKGRLTSVTDNSGSTRYQYDNYGRLLNKTQVVDGISLVTRYQYDSVGRLDSVTYPSGRVLGFSYHQGQLQQLNVDSAARIENIQMQPFAGPTQWSWGDNTSYNRAFNLDGQLQSYTLGNDTVSLNYDRAGRITAQSHQSQSSRNQQYYYDMLDRITGSSGAFNLGFNYDANGNRLNQTESSLFSEYSVSQTSNRTQSISGALNRSYQYDEAGNTLSDGERNFSYNSANRLTHINKGSISQTNLYNGLGQRVRKTVGSNNTLYAYDEAGHLIGEYHADGSVKMEVVYLGDQPVLAMSASGVFYIHADHLNTPRAIIGANQIVIWRWDSSAFGDTRANEDADGNGIAFTFNHRFPGQVYDADVALHYNYFRNYDPVTGRYIESDPIGLRAGVNTYGYVGANPNSLSDASGLWATNAHNELIDRFGANYRIYPHNLQSMMAGSKEADAMFRHWQFWGNQGDDYSYMHALTSSTIPDKNDACLKTKKFIEEKMKEFDYWSRKGGWADYKAYHALGMALHPVMDSTSPAHTGYQSFSPYSQNDVSKHGPDSVLRIARPNSLEGLSDLLRDPGRMNDTIKLMKKIAEGGEWQCGCD